MNSAVWMAVGLVLVVEGLGPMLWPHLWRRMILSMVQMPDALLRRVGGGLVVAGIVIYFMLSAHSGG